MKRLLAALLLFASAALAGSTNWVVRKSDYVVVGYGQTSFSNYPSSSYLVVNAPFPSTVSDYYYWDGIMVRPASSALWITLKTADARASLIAQAGQSFGVWKALVCCLRTGIGAYATTTLNQWVNCMTGCVQ